jgi:hypothetical protein
VVSNDQRLKEEKSKKMRQGLKEKKEPITNQLNALLLFDPF